MVPGTTLRRPMRVVSQVADFLRRRAEVTSVYARTRVRQRAT